MYMKSFEINFWQELNAMYETDTAGGRLLHKRAKIIRTVSTAHQIRLEATATEE